MAPLPATDSRLSSSPSTPNAPSTSWATAASRSSGSSGSPIKATVLNFDRGWDVRPTDATATAVMDFLAAGLAEHIYHA